MLSTPTSQSQKGALRRTDCRLGVRQGTPGAPGCTDTRKGTLHTRTPDGPITPRHRDALTHAHNARTARHTAGTRTPHLRPYRTERGADTHTDTHTDTPRTRTRRAQPHGSVPTLWCAGAHAPSAAVLYRRTYTGRKRMYRLLVLLVRWDYPNWKGRGV